MDLAEMLASAKEQGRADAIEDIVEKIMSTLHEYDMIDCDLCPYVDKCNDDCWKVLRGD